MSRSALTMKVYGVYLLALGVGLMLIPNLLLALIRIAPTNEVWVRALGVAVVNLGICCWIGATLESRLFFRISVYQRLFVPVALGAFTLLGMNSRALMLFGVVDALAALWTWLALRADQRAGPPANPVSRIDPRYESRL